MKIDETLLSGCQDCQFRRITYLPGSDSKEYLRYQGSIKSIKFSRDEGGKNPQIEIESHWLARKNGQRDWKFFDPILTTLPIPDTETRLEIMEGGVRRIRVFNIVLDILPPHHRDEMDPRQVRAGIF